jgi:hypothetical protein
VKCEYAVNAQSSSRLKIISVNGIGWRPDCKECVKKQHQETLALKRLVPKATHLQSFLAIESAQVFVIHDDAFDPVAPALAMIGLPSQARPLSD